MKNLLTLIFCLLLSVAHAQTTDLEKLDSAEYFNFWEGEWEGTWQEGENEGRATNSLAWKTDGKVLEENFEIIEGQSKGFQGTSISVFQPRTNTWRQAWADNQGGYYDFIGKFEGNKRIFQTHPKEVNGKTIIQRMVFYDIKPDSFMWDWELSVDGGESWKLNWRIQYKRK